MKFLEATYYLTIIFLLGFILFALMDIELSTNEAIVNALFVLWVAIMFGIYRDVKRS